MNFRFIDLLGLELNVDLNVLKRQTQRYSSLLYQHEGTLYADENRIGNQYNADKKLITFFNKAKELNVDLAMTPEYSCPWNVIAGIVSNVDHWPAAGKLWVVCCESIQPAELIKLKDDFGSETINFHYSTNFESSTKSFIDPLIYIFRAIKNGTEILQLLIQYKSMHMGVYSGGDVERNNIIHGNEIYILRNSNHPTLYLMSAICSEAMNFSNYISGEVIENIEWEDKPYLILNPQLNPDAAHLHFRTFRQFVLQQTDKEIISLNWNNNSKIFTADMMRDNCSRTAIYLKSNAVDDEGRINNNHKKGMYYFFCKQDKHYFLLSSTPHCFHIENLPVKISSPVDAQIRRDGPEIINAYCFNDTYDNFDEISFINDGLIEFLKETGCSNAFLLDENTSVLNKERLVCLSSGEVDGNKKQGWYRAQSLLTVLMDVGDEKNKRFTVGRSELNFDVKTRFTDVIVNLEQILADEANYPNCISDLKNQNIIPGFSVNSHRNYFRQNVISDAGEQKNATVAYLGFANNAKVSKTFVEIRKLFDINDNDRNRVVVYYKRGDRLLSEFAKTGTNFTDIDTYGDVSFKR